MCKIMKTHNFIKSSSKPVFFICPLRPEFARLPSLFLSLWIYRLLCCLCCKASLPLCLSPVVKETIVPRVIELNAIVSCPSLCHNFEPQLPSQSTTNQNSKTHFKKSTFYFVFHFFFHNFVLNILWDFLDAIKFGLV